MALSRKESQAFPSGQVGPMELCCFMQAPSQVVCHTKGTAQVMGQACPRGLVCSTTEHLAPSFCSFSLLPCMGRFPRSLRRTRYGLPLGQVCGPSGNAAKNHL